MIIHAELHQIYVQDSDKIHNVLEYEGSQWSCQRKQIWAEDAQGVERHSQRKFGSSFSFKNLDFFLQAIRAPIVWNRPTTGLFDYHYDVAGLYYQVMLILILMLILPLSRWSTTVWRERRAGCAGWWTCQTGLCPTTTGELSKLHQMLLETLKMEIYQHNHVLL